MLNSNQFSSVMIIEKLTQNSKGRQEERILSQSRNQYPRVSHVHHLISQYNSNIPIHVSTILIKAQINQYKPQIQWLSLVLRLGTAKPAEHVLFTNMVINIIVMRMLEADIT